MVYPKPFYLLFKDSWKYCISGGKRMNQSFVYLYAYSLKFHCFQLFFSRNMIPIVRCVIKWLLVLEICILWVKSLASANGRRVNVWHSLHPERSRRVCLWIEKNVICRHRPPGRISSFGHSRDFCCKKKKKKKEK